MTRLLALLAVALVAVVALEVVHTPGTEGVAGASRVASKQSSAPAAARAAQAAGSLNRWVSVALARPLFAPDRKPEAGVGAVDPGMPRLTGIIASPDGAIAIFQAAGATKSVAARHGERVGEWEVVAITADTVNLRKENEVVALSPQFAGTQHAGAAVRQASKTPPRWEAPAPSGILRARWSNAQLQP